MVDLKARSGTRETRGRRTPARMIPGADGMPALELLETRPRDPGRRPPLLFIHGAFGGAWMWDEVFLPIFAGQGRACAAVSIRGHGGSEGYDTLRLASLADYVTDVRRALAEMPALPVVIAHSLGGLVAQMLVGREPMRALVLLASLPPEGLFFVGPRFAATDPLIWTEAFMGSVTKAKGPIQASGVQLLFSEGLPKERLARYVAKLTPESPRALADAHAPPPVLSALAFSIPALVIGGGGDRVVLRPSALRTAVYHAAEYQTLERMGHFLLLDPGAEDVAGRVLQWLERQGL